MIPITVANGDTPLRRIAGGISVLPTSDPAGASDESRDTDGLLREMLMPQALTLSVDPKVLDPLPGHPHKIPAMISLRSQPGTFPLQHYVIRYR